MENSNAQMPTLQGCFNQHPSCEVPASVGCAGDLLDMRQNDNPPLCPAAETDSSLMAYINRWTPVRLTARLQAAQAATAQENDDD